MIEILIGGNIMKRIICIISAVALLLSCFNLSAFAENEEINYHFFLRRIDYDVVKDDGKASIGDKLTYKVVVGKEAFEEKNLHIEWIVTGSCKLDSNEALADEAAVANKDIIITGEIAHITATESGDAEITANLVSANGEIIKTDTAKVYVRTKAETLKNNLDWGAVSAMVPGAIVTMWLLPALDFLLIAFEYPFALLFKTLF